MSSFLFSVTVPRHPAMAMRATAAPTPMTAYELVCTKEAPTRSWYSVLEKLANTPIPASPTPMSYQHITLELFTKTELYYSTYVGWQTTSLNDMNPIS